MLYLWIMFTMNVRLSLIGSVHPPLWACRRGDGVFYRKNLRPVPDRRRGREGDLTTCAQGEPHRRRPVVRGFGRERYEEANFRENQRFSQMWIRLGKLLSVYWYPAPCRTCCR